MLLKNLATASLGVLLSLKAMANDKEIYSTDMTRIESNESTLSEEEASYKICSDYRVSNFFAFDASAIGSAAQQTAIFGSKIAPQKLQSLLDLPLNDTYVFSAALELVPESATISEPTTTASI
ncbi:MULTISPECIES: hypothetical protein [unclassified Pseudomonas]|jgi:hypothetical protein|uniref:hypothetical protein n=1 Tax=unclassified Pseudomonas TaxID=196821 RepID=UPI00069DC14C|nr:MULTISPECIES: hypothetical protein [unclassified Pseudomonas]WPN45194.1 hypothetical protein QMK58_18670 [Pseudomonas sp. P8_241]